MKKIISALLTIALLTALTHQKIARTGVEFPKVTTKHELSDIDITKFFDFTEADQSSLSFHTTAGNLEEEYVYQVLPIKFTQFPSANFKNAIRVKSNHALNLNDTYVLAWDKDETKETGRCFAFDFSGTNSTIFGTDLSRNQCLDSTFERLDDDDPDRLLTFVSADGVLNFRKVYLKNKKMLKVDYKRESDIFPKNFGAKTLIVPTKSGPYLVVYKKSSDKNGSYGDKNPFLMGKATGNLTDPDTLTTHSFTTKFSSNRVQWANIANLAPRDKFKDPNEPEVVAWVVVKGDEGNVVRFYHIEEQGTLLKELDPKINAVGVTDDWKFYYEISFEDKSVTLCNLPKGISYKDFEKFKDDCSKVVHDFKPDGMDFVDRVEITSKDGVSRMRVMIRNKNTPQDAWKVTYLSFSKTDFFIPRPQQDNYLSYGPTGISMFGFLGGQPFTASFFYIQKVLNLKPKEITNGDKDVIITARDKDNSVDAKFSVTFVTEFEKFEVAHTGTSNTLLEVPESVYTHEFWNKPVTCKGDFIDSTPMDTDQGYTVSLSPYYFKEDPTSFFAVQNSSKATRGKNSCKIGDIEMVCENQILKGYKVDNGKISYVVDLSQLNLICIVMKCFSDIKTFLGFSQPARPDPKGNGKTPLQVSVLKFEDENFSKYKIRTLYPDQYVYTALMETKPTAYLGKNGDIVITNMERNVVNSEDFSIGISFKECYPFIHNFNIPDQKNEILTLDISAADDDEQKITLKFKIKYKIDQNNFKIFVKKKLEFTPGESKQYNVTDYFRWLGNGVVQDRTMQNKKTVKLIGYDSSEVDSTYRTITLTRTSSPSGSSSNFAYSGIFFSSRSYDLIHINKLNGEEISPKFTSAVKQFSYVSDQNNVCVIGLLYNRIFSFEDESVGKTFFAFDGSGEKTSFFDLGDLERVQILEPIGKKVKTLKFLGLTKDKQLNLYDFDCTLGDKMEFKKSPVLEGVVSFDYFSQVINEDDPYITIFAATGNTYNNTGLQVVSFEYSDFTKKLNFDFKTALDPVLEEVTAVNYVKIYYSRETTTLDVIIDGNDFRFFNFQGEINYDNDKQAFVIISPLKGFEKYRKSFISQRFGCDLTQDFIVCGSFSRTYMPLTKSIVSSDNNYMIFAKRNGKYGDKKGAGYSTTINQLAAYNIRASEASMALKHYKDNSIYLNKFKGGNNGYVCLADLSSGFKFSINTKSESSALEDVSVEFFGNYFSPDRKVDIKGQECVQDYSDIVNKNRNIFVMVIGLIALLALVVVSIRMFKENKKDKNQKTEQLRKALEADDSAAMNTQDA